MKVSADVLAVLDAADVDGPLVRLAGQLERPLYERTNKVLVAAGGRWNRQAGAHVFAANAADALDQILLTGEVTTPQDMGWFPTPPRVVEDLLERAALQRGMTALEPSAGEGAIAGPMRVRGADVHCIEIDARRVAVLLAAGHQVTCGDFLTMTPMRVYDRVVMNPPFARLADVHHVAHALGFVRPGGRLVAVMAAGLRFRQHLAATALREVIEMHGEIVDLPDGSFRESGTGVRALIVQVDRR